MTLVEGWTAIDNPANLLPGHAQRDDLVLALQYTEGQHRHAVLVVFLVDRDLSPLRRNDPSSVRRYINRSATALQAQPGLSILEQRVVTRDNAATLGLLRLQRDDDALRNELQLYDRAGQPAEHIEQLTLSLLGERGLVQVFLYQSFPHDKDALADPLINSLKAHPLDKPALPSQPLDRWLWLLVGGVALSLIGVRLMIGLRQRERRARLQTTPNTTAPPDMTQRTSGTPHAPWEQDLEIEHHDRHDSDP